MPTLADVVLAHRADYQAQHSLSFLERKTLEALLACRSGSLGSTLYQCADCGQKHFIHRSCGNRHCPQCQHHKTRQWVLDPQSRLLPVPYFLLTFTVPQPLRRFLRSHKRPGYEALFQASSQALKKLARDPRLLGSDLAGFTGVLHTWGRQLQYHPHIHYLVPARAVSPDRKQWLATAENFFLPVQALSVIFRAKFRDAIDKAGLLDQIPSDLWQQDWVVHCQAVGHGIRALEYLARYVFQVAIANSRILSCQDGIVTFSFRDKNTGQPRRVRLSAVEFIRRFLDHLLPTGFQKVRHYGFFSPTCSLSIERIRLLIAQTTGRPVCRRAHTRTVLSALWRPPSRAGHSAALQSLPPSPSAGQHRLRERPQRKSSLLSAPVLAPGRAVSVRSIRGPRGRPHLKWIDAVLGSCES